MKDIMILFVAFISISMFILASAGIEMSTTVPDKDEYAITVEMHYPLHGCNFDEIKELGFQVDVTLLDSIAHSKVMR